MPMEPWETKSSSASQEIPCTAWNPKAHYIIYKSLPLVPNLSQMNAVCALTFYSFKTHCIIILSSSLSSKWSLFFRFPTNTLHALLFSPMHAICPTHFSLN